MAAKKPAPPPAAKKAAPKKPGLEFTLADGTKLTAPADYDWVANLADGVLTLPSGPVNWSEIATWK